MNSLTCNFAFVVLPAKLYRNFDISRCGGLHKYLVLGQLELALELLDLVVLVAKSSANGAHSLCGRKRALGWK